MGGGSPSSTSQTTRSIPWEGVQPYLKDAFSEAQQLYQQGPQEYFPGQTFANFSPQQQRSLDMRENLATGALPQQISGIQGSYFNQLDPTVGNTAINPALGVIGQLSQGNVNTPQIGYSPEGVNIDPSQFTPSTAGMLGGAGNDALQQMLSGQVDTSMVNDLVGASNRDAIRDFERFVMPSIQDQAVASGQLGGSRQGVAEGIAASDLNQQLVDSRTQLLNEAMGRASNRQMAGTQLAGQLGLGGAELGGRLASSQAGMDQNTQQLLANLGITQAGFGLDAQQLATQQQLGAAGLGTDIYGTGLQNITRNLALSPQMLALGGMPADLMGQVGSAYQQMDQASIEEAMARHAFSQQAPYDALANYTQIIQPGLNFSTSAMQGQGASPNRFAMGAGGALSGAAMGAQLGSVVPGFGTAAGAIGGGIIGGLGGYYG